MRRQLWTSVRLSVIGLATASPASADPQADSLITRIVATNRGIHALSADISIEGVTGSNKTALHFTGACTLKRPDKWRFEVEGGLDMPGGRPRTYILVSDGARSWKVSAQSGWYTLGAARQKDAVLIPADPLSRFFFAGEGWLMQSQGRTPEATLLPTARIDGVECRGVQVSTSGIDTARQVQLYAGPDNIVRRLRESTYSVGADWIQITLKRVKVNPPAPKRSFGFAPLPGLRRSDQPVERQTWLTGFLLDEWNETRKDVGILEQEWPKLAGVWAGPFRQTSGMARRRYILRMERIGEDHHFEQFEETTAADGKQETTITHSAVLVVADVREKDGKQALVVRPLGSRPGQYDSEIRYQRVNGGLKLEGRLGSMELSGAWSRLPDKYPLRAF